MGNRCLCKAHSRVRLSHPPPYNMRNITCINCGKERVLKHTDANKYCNQVCQNEKQLKEKILPRFYKGEISNRRTLKRILTYINGNKCVLCGNTGEHNGKILNLQLDHVDGNASNDMPDNVRLLCPNCHSQTETYVARNKGNGRGSRQINR